MVINKEGPLNSGPSLFYIQLNESKSKRENNINSPFYTYFKSKEASITDASFTL